MTQQSTVDTRIVYRCNRCGIESAEPTCFVGVSKKGLQRLAVTCMTCTADAKVRTGARAAFGVAALICFPPFFVTAGHRDWNGQTFLLILAGCVMLPSLILLHELGHFLTARLLGLKSNLITMGVGKKLWSGRLLGVPLRIHAWPLAGLTYLGSDSLQGLRLRLWFTTLMGPMTHLVLIALPLTLIGPAARHIMPGYVAIWVLYNAFLFLINFIPFRSGHLGAGRTDGLALLLIPRLKQSDLAIYLSSMEVAAAMELYNEEDLVGASDICTDPLRRHPQNEWLLVLLSACQIKLGDYGCAQHTLQRAGDLSQIKTPAMRAVFMNNLAIAEWLADPAAPSENSSMVRANDLSGQAFVMFPCVLPYRSTRALMLAATKRPEEALQLLEYCNYPRGSDTERANQEVARAYALRQLNRNAESEAAIAAALKASDTVASILTTLGLAPPAQKATV